MKILSYWSAQALWCREVRIDPGGATRSHYVVITDQNFAVKGCPFQHRPRPARDVKRVSISLFFEKKGRPTFFIMAMSVFWVPILKNRL